jgi:hypothetical protein
MPDRLLDSSQYLQIRKKRQSLKSACPEEIVDKTGFVSREQIGTIIDGTKYNPDHELYLQEIVKEYDGTR